MGKAERNIKNQEVDTRIQKAVVEMKLDIMVFYKMRIYNEVED